MERRPFLVLAVVNRVILREIAGARKSSSNDGTPVKKVKQQKKADQSKKEDSDEGDGRVLNVISKERTKLCSDSDSSSDAYEEISYESESSTSAEEEDIKQSEKDCEKQSAKDCGNYIAAKIKRRKIKILVDTGADPNVIPVEDGGDEAHSPMQDTIDVS